MVGRRGRSLLLEQEASALLHAEQPTTNFARDLSSNQDDNALQNPDIP